MYNHYSIKLQKEFLLFACSYLAYMYKQRVDIILVSRGLWQATDIYHSLRMDPSVVSLEL